MAACDSSLQTLSWEDETSASTWGETAVTMTRAVRIIEPIDCSGITQTMLEPARVVSVRNDGTKGTPGPMAPTFSFSCWWTGRGATSAGAVTLTDLYELLKRAMGGGAVAAASGTTLTGGTANAPTTTASGTFSAGSIVPIGALGDGDGEGQFHAVATHVTTTLTLLTDMSGAPVNGAVLYASDMAYLAPSVCAMTGLRFRIQTADTQWVVHGCAITALALVQTDPGARPRWNFTVTGAWAEPVNAGTLGATTPTTADSFNGEAHSAGGSCFFQTVGTATRATLALRALSINIGLGVVMVPGGSGYNNYQIYTGATRTADSVSVNLTVDALGVSTSPTYWAAWLANTPKHMLISFNTGDGSGRAAYLRNMCPMDNRPAQNATDGRNTVSASFMAYNGATTTSDLTRSSLVVAGY